MCTKYFSTILGGVTITLVKRFLCCECEVKATNKTKGKSKVKKSGNEVKRRKGTKRANMKQKISRIQETLHFMYLPL